jgi:dienelactone hydrolase
MTQTHLVPTTTHGRVIVREAPWARGVIAGFHGYMENADIQLARLAAIPGAGEWTLASIQGLHRFYRGRREEVVASWMTRQDREVMIADNVGYVDAALGTVDPGGAARLVLAGFSQGVAMAFRAALSGRHAAAGVIAVGGDVPPELLAGPGRFPRVLLLRGARDEWYTQPKFDADAAALTARGVALDAQVYDAAHEWTDAVGRSIGRFLELC